MRSILITAPNGVCHLLVIEFHQCGALYVYKEQVELGLLGFESNLLLDCIGIAAPNLQIGNLNSLAEHLEIPLTAVPVGRCAVDGAAGVP